MAIKPVLHRIIILPDNIDDKDENYKRAKSVGIIVTRDERNREQAAIDTGKVVSIGPTAFLDFKVDEVPIEVDDYIVYARYAGKTIKDPETDVEYVALNDEDVIAVITKKEPKNG